MKAYAYIGRIAMDSLAEVERPDPVPGPFDIVVRMRAASLNYRDLAIANGDYHVHVDPPLVPVSDGAGTVAAIGSQVTRVRVNDLVCPIYLPDWIDGPISPPLIRRRLGGPNDGVLSEYVCAHEEAVVRLPAHLEPAEAATLPVTAVTAWHSLFQNGRLLHGESVVVLGTGGVSTAAMQLSKACGAQVIAVTRNQRHVDRLRAIGADEVLVAGDSAQWPAEVVKLTKGRGADVVVDVVGGPSLARSIAALRLGGCVHLVGYAADKSATLDIFDAIRHAATIRVAAAGNRASFEALARVMEQQKLRPAVDRRFPVSQFRQAFEYLSKGGHFGKVVLEF